MEFHHGDVCMTLIVFIIYTMTAVSFGAVIWGLLKIGSDADETIASAYWCQVAFMSRSIMTEEQKKKLDEMMEEK